MRPGTARRRRLISALLPSSVQLAREAHRIHGDPEHLGVHSIRWLIRLHRGDSGQLERPTSLYMWREQPRLTLRCSKTQKLVPSSSTWFQNLNPTSTRPETFRTVQKSSERSTTTITVCGS